MPFDDKDFSMRIKASADYMVGLLEKIEEDFSFVALKQWTKEDVDIMKRTMRPTLVFDLIGPLLKAVSGSEMTTRFKADFVGFNLESDEVDKKAAEIYDLIYNWQRQQCMAEHQESLAFKDLITGGIGCIDTYLDYSRFPGGQIITKRFPCFDAGWAPGSVEQNVRDAEYIFRSRQISEKEIKFLWPKQYEEILSNVKEYNKDNSGGGSGWLGGFLSKHSRFIGQQYSKSKGNVSSLLSPGNTTTKTIKVYDFQYTERFLEARIVIPAISEEQPEQIMMVPQTDLEDELERVVEFLGDLSVKLRQTLPEPKVDEQIPSKKYYRALLCGGITCSNKITGIRDFTIQILTGEEDWSEYPNSKKKPGYKKYFGLVRRAADPQRFRNKAYSQAVHVWNSNPKGVLLYEQSLFIDSDKGKEDWNTAGGAIPLRDGALQGADKFKHISQGNPFSGVEPLFRHASEGVGAAMGVNAAYTGGQASDLKRTAYSSVESIKESNLASMSDFFDSLSLYRKVNAQIVVSLARKWLSQDTLARVVGSSKVELLPIFMELDVQDYDIVVSESPNTPTPNKELSVALIQNMAVFQAAGIPFPPSMLKYLASDFPDEVGQDWQRMYEEMLGVQQQQQQAAMDEGAATGEEGEAVQ